MPNGKKFSKNIWSSVKLEKGAIGFETWVFTLKISWFLINLERFHSPTSCKKILQEHSDSISSNKRQKQDTEQFPCWMHCIH